MTNYEFALWLCGFLFLEPELKAFSIKQLVVVSNHLNLAKEVDGKLTVDNLWLEQLLQDITEENDFSQTNMEQCTQLIKKRYMDFFKKEVIYNPEKL